MLGNCTKHLRTLNYWSLFTQADFCHSFRPTSSDLWLFYGKAVRHLKQNKVDGGVVTSPPPQVLLSPLKCTVETDALRRKIKENMTSGSCDLAMPLLTL